MQRRAFLFLKSLFKSYENALHHLVFAFSTSVNPLILDSNPDLLIILRGHLLLLSLPEC